MSEAVRTFVEEKLLTRRGFRNLVVYEEAVSAPGVNEDDIEELVRRRLVRVEERGRLRLLELSHDLLTGVVTASRDERRRRAREADAVKKLEERLRRTWRRGAILLLVVLLAVGALGGLGWAYLAQKQADELAEAKEAAERAAAEASSQRAIAETRRQEAEWQQLEAENARELAESAATEASRLQRIADAQREEALRQRQEAIRARAEAERAAADALVQKNLAEEQRGIAQERQREVEESQRLVQETNDALVEALRERLASSDPGEVLGALDILVRGSQESESVLARIDDGWFTSSRDFVPLLVALQEVAENQPNERWTSLRKMLVARFSERTGRGASPAPSAADRVLVPGGHLNVGASSFSEDGPGERGSRVLVSPFYLGRTEVTNGEFRRFEPAHAPRAPDDHPVTNVSWYDSMAYAAWVGGTLPTEAQWELAARGEAGRRYPWGNEKPSRLRANFAHDGDDLGTTRVGSYPEGATPEGVLDLAGNVWEWCLDGAAPGSATIAGYGSRDDPLGSPSSPTRILKGGSYFNDERYLPADRRNFLHPEGIEDIVGFRVAWPALETNP